MFSYHIFQNNYTAIITEYILYLRKFNDSLGYSVDVREYVLTKEKRIICSMFRKGIPTDNAPIESFQSFLKCKAFYIKDEVITSFSMILREIELQRAKIGQTSKC